MFSAAFLSLQRQLPRLRASSPPATSSSVISGPFCRAPSSSCLCSKNIVSPQSLRMVMSACHRLMSWCLGGCTPLCRPFSAPCHLPPHFRSPREMKRGGTRGPSPGLCRCFRQPGRGLLDRWPQPGLTPRGLSGMTDILSLVSLPETRPLPLWWPVLPGREQICIFSLSKVK